MKLIKITPPFISDAKGTFMNTASLKKHRTTIICVMLIVITLSVFMPARSHQFIDYDDDVYVTANPHVTTGMTGDNVIWAFTAIYAGNWHPLTWLSHIVDAQIYGLDPRGHHLTNIFIHTAATVLLFLLLSRITAAPWRSSFVALLFAIHPLHVESVVWVAERKDVLSCFFLFVTLLLYTQYVRNKSFARYFLVLFSFIFGLMTKSMLVTLPVMLLLMDYWPLGRFNLEPSSGLSNLLSKADPLPLLLKEKIPFIACSLLSSAVTLYAQHEGRAITSYYVIPWEFRLENALISYVQYICKTIWPRDLAVLYPLSSTLPFWQAIGSLIFLIIISVLTVRARRQHPYLPVGWFWFLITLVPVIGLIQVGTQSMADRYTYIPIIGLFIIAAWGIPELTKRLHHRQITLIVLAFTVISASIVATRQQLSYWKDSISLFQHTLQVTANNYTIHYNLGVIYAAHKELEKAEQEFLSTLSIEPNFPNAHNNLGSVYFEQGRLDEAEKLYKYELAINPANAQSRLNLQLLHNMQQRNDAGTKNHL